MPGVIARHTAPVFVQTAKEMIGQRLGETARCFQQIDGKFALAIMYGETHLVLPIVGHVLGGCVRGHPGARKSAAAISQCRYRIAAACLGTVQPSTTVTRHREAKRSAYSTKMRTFSPLSPASISNSSQRAHQLFKVLGRQVEGIGVDALRPQLGRDLAARAPRTTTSPS